MLSAWTIGRATGAGASAGLLALILWPLWLLFDALFWPTVVAAAVAGLCGLSILAITVADLLFHRRRGARIRPVRIFDVVLGASLVLLAFAELKSLEAQGFLLTFS